MGCHDAPMSETTEHMRPTGNDTNASRHAVGLGLTALGGVTIVIGALLPWIRSSLEGFPDGLSPTYLGIDLPDGIVAIAAGIVVLASLVATRIASSTPARRFAAWLVIAGAIVAIVAAGTALVTAAGRFEPATVDDVIASLEASGSTATPEQRAQVEDLVETRVAPGLFAVLAGGALGVVGGLLLVPGTRVETVSEPRPEGS